MFGIGFTELLVIMVVALLVVGPRKLPQVARKIARGMRDIREVANDAKASILDHIDEDHLPPTGKKKDPPSPPPPPPSSPPST